MTKLDYAIIIFMECNEKQRADFISRAVDTLKKWQLEKLYKMLLDRPHERKGIVNQAIMMMK